MYKLWRCRENESRDLGKFGSVSRVVFGGSGSAGRRVCARRRSLVSSRTSDLPSNSRLSSGGLSHMAGVLLSLLLRLGIVPNHFLHQFQ